MQNGCQRKHCNKTAEGVCVSMKLPNKTLKYSGVVYYNDVSTPNEPAADNAGCRGTETWLGLLNMGTKIENMTCYRPHMRLPAGR